LLQQGLSGKAQQFQSEDSHVIAGHG